MKTWFPVTVLAAALLAGCERADPVEPDSITPQASRGATVTREEWGPEAVLFNPPAPCLGEGARLDITGTISGWDLIVERADGSIHLTEYVDFTNLVGTFDGHTWTAGPGSHEMWSINWPPDVPLSPVNGRQTTHVGNTVFRAEDGTPDLKFVHQIHLVRLPSGELHTLRVILEVYCIGPDR